MHPANRIPPLGMPAMNGDRDHVEVLDRARVVERAHRFVHGLVAPEVLAVVGVIHGVAADVSLRWRVLGPVGPVEGILPHAPEYALEDAAAIAVG